MAVGGADAHTLAKIQGTTRSFVFCLRTLNSRDMDFIFRMFIQSMFKFPSANGNPAVGAGMVSTADETLIGILEKSVIASVRLTVLVRLKGVAVHTKM